MRHKKNKALSCFYCGGVLFSEVEYIDNFKTIIIKCFICKRVLNTFNDDSYIRRKMVMLKWEESANVFHFKTKGDVVICSIYKITGAYDDINYRTYVLGSLIGTFKNIEQAKLEAYKKSIDFSEMIIENIETLLTKKDQEHK